MNKLIILIVSLLFLQSCSTIDSVQQQLPSFWDDNQSKKIIDIRQSVVNLDCTQPHLPQITQIKHEIEWFELYSTSKKRQYDVLRLILPLKESVQDFYNRSSEQQGSKFYCESKKSILDVQSKTAADAVLRRF